MASILNQIKTLSAKRDAAPPKGINRTTAPKTTAPKTTTTTTTTMTTPGKKKYRWPTDPKGKAPVHTITYAKHQANMKPLVAGGTLKVGDANRAAQAAADTTYGGVEGEAKTAIGEAKTFATDVTGPGGFYDQYLAKLAEHATNTNAIGATATGALQGLQAGVTGLSQATLAPIQGQADAGAAARGTGPAGDYSKLASDAAAIRQSLVGAFGADQASRNHAAEVYADTLAKVVGPGQKLGAQVQGQAKIKEARQKLADIKGQKGALKTKYISELTDSETKNVIAAATLAGKTQADLDKEQRAADRAANSPTALKTKAELKFFKQHGYWPPTGPPTPKSTPKEEFYTSGAYNGYSHSEIAKMTPKERHKLVTTYNAMTHPPAAGPGGTTPKAAPGFTAAEAGEFQRKFGIAPASVARIDKGYNEIQRGKDVLRMILSSKKNATRAEVGAAMMAGRGPGKTEDAQGNKVDRNHWRALNPLWVKIVLDVWKLGGVSASTAGRMHSLGYSAKALGVPLAPPVHELEHPTQTR